MQVSYYNIGRAVWEPLIEPVEVLKDYQYKHVPWELKMEVIIITKTLQKKKKAEHFVSNVTVVVETYPMTHYLSKSIKSFKLHWPQNTILFIESH